MRSSATTRKTPTPAATAPTSTALGMPGTSEARTWRSGSEMVTTTPMRKLTETMTQTFRELAMWAPACSPMGVMAASAPRVKKPMPRISSTAPARKASSASTGRGATVRQRTSTMAVMGSTEARASRTFSPRTVFVRPIRSFQRPSLPTGPPPLQAQFRI